MKRSILTMVIVSGVVAALIVWKVAFAPPVAAQMGKPVETESVAGPGKPGQVDKPSDANKPKLASDANKPAGSVILGEPNKPAKPAAAVEPNKPATQTVAVEPNKPGEPNEPMEALNLKDVEMKDIIAKVADWTGKTVIPNDEAMKQKITIYAPHKLPRNKALDTIYSALRVKGYVAEYTDDKIFLKPIAEWKVGLVPTVPADQPLALFENKDQIVQKFFKLANYSPGQMGQVIQPLLGEYGHVGADESTGSLLVVDTVGNLMRIERVIAGFDISQAGQTVTEIFEVHNGNPEDIVRLLETLLVNSAGSSVRGPGRGDRQHSPESPPGAPSGPPSGGPPKKERSGKGGAATSVFVGISRTQITLVAEPKYNWIIAKASPEDMKQIGEWIKRLDRSVPTMLADYPLARIENKNQVVQKFFKLDNYSPTQMAQVVGPLLAQSGYVSADESTGNLLVIDTVENLMRIEMIIDQFDVPEAEQTVTEVFDIVHGDPSEIVQLLRMLLGDGTGGAARGYSRSGYGRSGGYGRSSGYDYEGGSGYSSRSDFMSGGLYRGSSRSGAATSVVIGPSQMPVVLIPEPKRKWIIARASAEDMKLIEQWITKLDRDEPVKSEYEAIPVTYADVREVAQRLNDALEQMPGTELRASVLVQPLEQSKQIMVFGRKDLREMVRKLIEEVDIPPGQFETQYFKLKYADPDQIKTNIDELFSEQSSRSSSRYSSIYYFGDYYGSRRGGPVSPDTVKVISYISLKQVTVIASAENMKKIADQIEQWDRPLDVNEVKPRIIELHNCDPVQIADLLKQLFSEQTSGRMSIYEYIFGYSSEEKQKIIGPLYGQLTFEDVPGTKKLIVISKIPEAYHVVEELINELDRQEMAEVPKVVTLKYADPEDLAERLNAIFNEPGTTATIRRSVEGLSESLLGPTDQSSSQSQANQGSRTGTNTPTASQAEYRPWWTTGQRAVDQEPISNVIGRVRFIPDPHSKAILVLAPPEFMANIEKTIHDLDVPGKQVLIKAVIVQVDHTTMTSLGLQLASDPSSFGSLGENAIRALNQLTYMETHGSLAPQRGAIGLGPGVVGTGAGTVLGAGTDVYALLDFLVKKVNAKVLNQQTLWTKDNEEAMFFKGQTVAFLAGSTIAAGVGSQQNVDFQDVGMTLQARPSITPEKNVDMRVRVILSQITSELVNNQPVRSRMNTESNMIIQDGQTIMLSGILFQEDSLVERKIPLLGDIPLAGGLFRHNESVQGNNELIVFITPYVVDEPNKTLPETIQEIEGPKQKLKDIQEQLKSKPLANEEGWQGGAEPKKTDEQLDERQREVAEAYYRSMRFYHDGEFEKAREGFVKVLESSSIPAPIEETVQSCLSHTDSILAQRGLVAKASHFSEP